jgi:D-alanyl-D-alanine carboxypeptidase (penicillin-binding protein 5/6)
VRFLLPFLLSLSLTGSLAGCGSTSSYGQSFSDNSQSEAFNFMIHTSGSAGFASSFAKNLCVVEGDTNLDAIPDMADTSYAALFDCNNTETLYAKDVYTQAYPASLTKVMTALVALENATPDTILTASSNVYINDAEAQIVGLKEGDTMTLDQALHLLLVYSANDIAVLIAENIGGSVDNFVKMMNEEAASLGATNTNFINSNGLSDSNHYTCVYDMYLIFNRALDFREFNEVISTANYTTVYHDKDGNEKSVNVNSTNLYLQDYQQAPTGVTVIGGKTGTTTAAGHCLVLLARDTSGRPYIAIVMRAINQDMLYSEMNELLSLIPAQAAKSDAAAKAASTEGSTDSSTEAMTEESAEVTTDSAQAELTADSADSEESSTASTDAAEESVSEVSSGT